MQANDMRGRARRTLFVALSAALWILMLHGFALAQQSTSSPADSGGVVARAVTTVVTTPDVPDDTTTAAANTPASTEAGGFLPEPRFIRWTVSKVDQFKGEGGRSKSGFFPEVSNMITGAGWISAGPGYRQWLFNNQALAEASTAVSWRFYKMAQARLEFPSLMDDHLTAGTQYLWRDATQVTYFGEGPDSSFDNRSEYRLRMGDFVGYAMLRPYAWLQFGGKAGWMQRPIVSGPTGSFQRGNPPTQEMFPNDPVFARGDQPNFFHGETSVAADFRDSRSHPVRGGIYRASWQTFVDRTSGQFSFRMYEGEAAQFLPLASERIVLAVHGWVVGTDTTDGRTVPFYLEPMLGGGNFMRSYTDYRFHDRNMMVVNLESRFALTQHLDVAAFMDAGNVAAKFSDLNFDKRGYGGGVRIHTSTTTFGRLDISHGPETGWRFLARTGDPLHLSRLSRKVIAAPFTQ